MRPFARVTSNAARFPTLRGPCLRLPLTCQFRIQSTWTRSGTHRVYLPTPWINWRRVGLWTFYSVSSYAMLKYLLVRLVDGLELEDEDEAGEDQHHEEEDDEAQIGVLRDPDDEISFLPAQVPKQLPRQSYKQFDPEWQEFVKFNRDSERQKTARQDLSEKLVHAASESEPLQQKLGQDIKWTKSWFDVTYPKQAAPEYIRQGWVLLDDRALWSKQVIPHSHYIQIRHILWPKPWFTAAKTALEACYTLQVIKVKNAAGMKLSAEETQLQRVSRAMLMQVMFVLKHKYPQLEIDHQIKVNVGADPHLNQFQQQIQKQILDKPSSSEAQSASLTQSLASKVKVPLAKFYLEVKLVGQVFSGTFAQAWKQSKLDTMPPGCCYFSGDVELVGSQGRCKLGVLAAYDPKASSFIWVECKPKAFWSRVQMAKG